MQDYCAGHHVFEILKKPEKICRALNWQAPLLTGAHSLYIHSVNWGGSETAMTIEPIEQLEGTPLIAPSSTDHPLYDSIVAACRSVYDPEIPVNIYDLGLIYTIDISDDGAVTVLMSLTAPGCPVAG